MKSGGKRNSKRGSISPAKQSAHREVSRRLFLDDLCCDDLVAKHIYKCPFTGFGGPRINYETIVRELRRPRPGPPAGSAQEISELKKQLIEFPRDEGAAFQKALPRPLANEEKEAKRMADDARKVADNTDHLSEEEKKALILHHQRAFLKQKRPLPSSEEREELFAKLVTVLSPKLSKEGYFDYSPPLTIELRKNFQTASRTKQFVPTLVKSGRLYGCSRITGAECSNWRFPDALMVPLAIESMSNPAALTKFLIAIFDRWREHDASGSRWRFRSVVHEQASWRDHDTMIILGRLQELGVVPSDKDIKPSELESVTARIKHCFSREIAGVLGGSAWAGDNS